MPRSSEEVQTTARSLPLRHRGLDLAPLRHVERAVMQRDGEAVVVHAPELLEQHLGLAAGVDEDERGAVAADQVVDLAERMARRVPGPGQLLGGVQHGDDRRGARLRHDDIGMAADCPAPALDACGTR